MKRVLLSLLCACFLLCGCHNGNTTLESTLPTVPSVPLLEQGTALAESPNLLDIPCEALDQMISPQLHLIGDGLLLSGFNGNSVILKYLSLQNGDLLAEAAIAAAPATGVFCSDGEIGLCDWMSGRITILDENLQSLRSYSVPQGGDDWYLSPKLDTLYIFFSDRGILARDLESGDEKWLLDDSLRVFCRNTCDRWLIFDYIDQKTQRTHMRSLDLLTGNLEEIPLQVTVYGVSRMEDIWVLNCDHGMSERTLIRDGAQFTFSWPESDVKLLAPQGHLLMRDQSGQNMILFSTDGTFISGCTLPESSSTYTSLKFVWSDRWKGYFFVDYVDDSWRLMFWDVNTDTAGEALLLSQPVAGQDSVPLLAPEHYERAAELSERFGVEILIGEQCQLEYTHYESIALRDSWTVNGQLDILEHTLSKYPEGFFRQLCYGTIDTIRFELVGALQIKDGVETHPTSVGAFAQQKENHYLIVLDAFSQREETVYHELSHIITARLEWDSDLRKDALYSGEAWLNHQPEGFAYAYDYSDIPQEVLNYLDSGYFLREYCLTFPTEDQAVLMASAMMGEEWNFEPDTGRHEKMRFLAACIRDCFDTQGWPETTPWELVLK